MGGFKEYLAEVEGTAQMAQPKLAPQQQKRTPAIYAADDVVPDRNSPAYKHLQQVYQQGGRMSMKGLTREEMKLALRGKLTKKA